MKTYSKSHIKNEIANNLKLLGVNPKSASNEKIYKAIAMFVNEILANRSRHFSAQNASNGKKQVSYISMEFLMGRSLKNNLFNLGLTDTVEELLAEFSIKLDEHDKQPYPLLSHSLH